MVRKMRFDVEELHKVFKPLREFIEKHSGDRKTVIIIGQDRADFYFVDKTFDEEAFDKFLKVDSVAED